MYAKCLVFELQLAAGTNYFELGLEKLEKAKEANYSIGFGIKGEKQKMEMLHALGIVTSAWAVAGCMLQ